MVQSVRKKDTPLKILVKNKKEEEDSRMVYRGQQVLISRREGVGGGGVAEPVLSSDIV